MYLGSSTFCSFITKDFLLFLITSRNFSRCSISLDCSTHFILSVCARDASRVSFIACLSKLWEKRILHTIKRRSGSNWIKSLFEASSTMIDHSKLNFRAMLRFLTMIFAFTTKNPEKRLIRRRLIKSGSFVSPSAFPKSVEVNRARQIRQKRILISSQ